MNPPNVNENKVSLETFRVENENENENVPCMVNVHVYGKPTIAADRTYELLYDSLADASSPSSPAVQGIGSWHHTSTDLGSIPLGTFYFIILFVRFLREVR